MRFRLLLAVFSLMACPTVVCGCDDGDDSQADGGDGDVDSDSDSDSDSDTDSDSDSDTDSDSDSDSDSDLDTDSDTDTGAECELYDGSGCPDGQKCGVIFGDDARAGCVPDGAKSEGERCSVQVFPQSERGVVSDNCEAGYFCLSDTDGRRRCRQICIGGEDCQDQPNQICAMPLLPDGDVGVCRQTTGCDPICQTGCNGDLGCYFIGDGINIVADCFPYTPPGKGDGDGQEGDVCQYIDNCRAGMSCHDEGNDAVCRPYCGPASCGDEDGGRPDGGAADGGAADAGGSNSDAGGANDAGQADGPIGPDLDGGAPGECRPLFVCDPFEDDSEFGLCGPE